MQQVSLAKLLTQRTKSYRCALVCVALALRNQETREALEVFLIFCLNCLIRHEAARLYKQEGKSWGDESVSRNRADVSYLRLIENSPLEFGVHRTAGP